MNPEPPLPAVCNPRWTGRCAGMLGAALALLLHGAPAKADIWGYIDADRMPHFASSQLDERYELFLRDSDVVEPYQRTQAPAPAKAADYALEVTPLAAPAPVAVSPAASRQVAFIERSPIYKAVSPLLREASSTHGIDYSLLKALIATESGFNPHAVSPKGAVGLMQLIPPTAERYGVTAGKGVTIQTRLTDPKVNIKAGARYLAYLIKMFPGRLELALAAYNAGEGAVQRAGNKIPNYPETQKYVKTVMQLYSGLAPAGFKAAQAFKAAPAGRVRVELKGPAPTRRGNAPAPAEPRPGLLRTDFQRE